MNTQSMKRAFLMINCLILAVGNCGGPLIMRLYFVHGGKRVWFSSFLQTSGWPVMLVPLALSYTRRKPDGSGLVLMGARVFAAAAAIGTLMGLVNFLFAYGVARLSMNMKRAFLILNCFILAVGNCGGPLIMRLYFFHGGKRVWFSSFLQTAGWPTILLPLTVSYSGRRRKPDGSGLVLMGPRVFAAAAVIGVLMGLDNFLFAYGVARLPVSTSSLITASQLAFTAVFSFLLVRQKFSAFSVNAVVLLTLGAAVLGLHASGDRPRGESGRAYFTGFMTTMAAAAMYGFILPLIEMTYNKAKQGVTFTVVLEIQLVMCFFATAFCAVGMIVNNDFQAIAREAKAYAIGETKYYLVVVSIVIIWQCFFLGAIGVIFYSSSLLSAIVNTVLLPVTEVLAVIFFREAFQAEKGLSLFLSLWGFASYFYGEFKQNKIKEDLELQTSIVVP